MPETASPPLAAERTAVDVNAVSPELVLVDPELREHLASLPPPDPRVTPASAPVDQPALAVEAPPPPAAGPAEAPLRVAEPIQLTPPAPPPPVSVPTERSRTRRWPVFVAVLVGGALALAATVALLPRGKSTPDTARVVDPSSTGHIGQPASSTPRAHATTAVTPTTQSTPPRPTTHGHASVRTTHAATTPGASRTTPTTKHNPTKTAKPPTKRPPPATTQDKLAWAPAAGATAYDIDLLRGSKRVFHVRTHQTSIIIAVRTGARGPAGSLAPGQYEWIVWPVVNGKRSTQAIVRSPLELPS